MQWIAAAGLGSLSLAQLTGDAPRNEGTPEADIDSVIESELDETVLRYADMSPFLREQLEHLQAEGWTIGFGDTEALYEYGSAAGLTMGDAKTIVIDNDLKDDPLWATAVLAHEVGHAYPGSFDAITDPPTPGEKYDAWLERNMRMRYMAEAESGLVTARVRQEILDSGGPDIGHVGEETLDVHNRERAGDLTHDEARDQLTDVLSHDPYEGYREQLEEHWDGNYVDSHGPSVVDEPSPEIPPAPPVPPGLEGGDGAPPEGGTGGPGHDDSEEDPHPPGSDSGSYDPPPAGGEGDRVLPVPPG